MGANLRLRGRADEVCCRSLAEKSWSSSTLLSSRHWRTGRMEWKRSAREEGVRCAISGASQGSRAVGVAKTRGGSKEANEQKKIQAKYLTCSVYNLRLHIKLVYCTVTGLLISTSSPARTRLSSVSTSVFCYRSHYHSLPCHSGCITGCSTSYTHANYRMSFIRISIIRDRMRYLFLGSLASALL